MWQVLRANPFFVSCLLSSLLLGVWRLRFPECGLPRLATLFLPIWSIGSTLFLGISALLTPATLDHYLYLADGSFGFQPAFAGARLLLANGWLWKACEISYFNLPLGLTLIYLLSLRRDRARAREFLCFAVLVAAAGFVIYLIFPAVGPAAMFKSGFPSGTPHVSPGRTVVGITARNCIPSLHTAWIIVLLWGTAAAPRWMRPGLWIFSACNLLYALSAGGHYLVDLIVAVPFTLAVHHAMRREWRSAAFVGNALLVALWLTTLRYGIPALEAAYLAPYGLTAVTLAFGYRTRPRAALSPDSGHGARVQPVRLEPAAVPLELRTRPVPSQVVHPFEHRHIES
jgi:hypothetical protein